MPIEISGQQPRHSSGSSDSTSVQGTRRRAANTEENAGLSTAQDTISLTDTVNLLRRMEDLTANTPVIDLQRVAAVKEAITMGSYQIDPLRVADKLLNFERTVHG